MSTPRESFLSRASNFHWQRENALRLVDDYFGVPTLSQQVTVSVQGGPDGDIRRLHWLACAVAFGRVDSSKASGVPVTISAQWSITSKHVVVSIEYTATNYMAAVAYLTRGNISANTGDYSAASVQGYLKLVAGPNSDATGGVMPAWLINDLNKQGITPTEIPAAADGKRLGPDFAFPESGKSILQMQPLSNGSSGTPAVNPQPPISDGIRSSMLAMVRASLYPSGERLDVDQQRPKNTYSEGYANGLHGESPDNTYKTIDADPAPVRQNPETYLPNLRL